MQFEVDKSRIQLYVKLTQIRKFENSEIRKFSTILEIKSLINSKIQLRRQLFYAELNFLDKKLHFY